MSDTPDPVRAAGCVRAARKRRLGEKAAALRPWRPTAVVILAAAVRPAAPRRPGEHAPVAADAGVSRSTLYRHFPTRESLEQDHARGRGRAPRCARAEKPRRRAIGRRLWPCSATSSRRSWSWAPNGASAGSAPCRSAADGRRLAVAALPTIERLRDRGRARPSAAGRMARRGVRAVDPSVPGHWRRRADAIRTAPPACSSTA